MQGANTEFRLNVVSFFKETEGLTDEEVGKYFRLLLYQAQHGEIDRAAWDIITGGKVTPHFHDKFKVLKASRRVSAKPDVITTTDGDDQTSA